MTLYRSSIIDSFTLQNTAGRRCRHTCLHAALSLPTANYAHYTIPSTLLSFSPSFSVSLSLSLLSLSFSLFLSPSLSPSFSPSFSLYLSLLLSLLLSAGCQPGCIHRQPDHTPRPPIPPSHAGLSTVGLAGLPPPRCLPAWTYGRCPAHV